MKFESTFCRYFQSGTFVIQRIVEILEFIVEHNEFGVEEHFESDVEISALVLEL